MGQSGDGDIVAPENATTTQETSPSSKAGRRLTVRPTLAGASGPRGTISVPGSSKEGGNNIRVAVRIRPFNAKETAEAKGAKCDPMLDVLGQTVSARAFDRFGMHDEYAKEKSFTYDSVFCDYDPIAGKERGTQLCIFEVIGVPILQNALDAYNGCIMAYGQTGSGKSYTMLGDPNDEEEKGILPRSLEALFEMIEDHQQELEEEGTKITMTILASYLEIYQEKMFDLLINDRTDLQVRLHPTLGPHVPGLTESPVKNIAEVRELLDFGAKNRAVGATSMNANSSRSHAVFSIDLRLSYSGAKARDCQSRVHFVDLAGSEKQKKTHASGERLQEGIAINQSLSSLSRVIQALAGKGIQPVFRESKLTLLLKDALSGNSKTVLMACVSPAKTNLDESLSTLEFAARCKLIKTNAKKNEQDKRALIETLSAEKTKVEEQLEEEMRQKRLLQHELEKEVEESKRNQELALKMAEEKKAIEQQLLQLESTAKERQVQVEQASGQTIEIKSQLKRAEEELELVRKTQEHKQKSWEDQQQSNKDKEAALMKKLEELEQMQEQMQGRNEEAASSSEEAKRKMELELEALRSLREQEAATRQEELQKLEERERENQEQAKKELEHLEKKKAEELSRAEAERQKAVSELQAKLIQVQAREEEERLRIQENAKTEMELRKRIEEEMQRVQANEEDLKRELAGLQSLSNSWALKNQDIEQKAQEQKVFRENLLKELGIVGMDMEDSQNAPRLVNMNPDPSLEGCLIYYLTLGETRIGADPNQCDICLTGLDVTEVVCAISNSENEVLEVHPLPGGLVRVNGSAVTESSQELAAGDRLAIGRAHIFRVVIPKHNTETNRDEEDFSQAMRELQECAQVDPRWRRGVDAAVMMVKRDFGTREANLLLDEAKAASEVVAEANAILKQVGSEEWTDGVSHYELAVLFEADGPPVVCVVARQDGNAQTKEVDGVDGVQERAFSAGIWEAGRFVEQRLSLMHEAADQLQLRRQGARTTPAPPVASHTSPASGAPLASVVEESPPAKDQDNWEFAAWSEVQLEKYQELAQHCKELSVAKKTREQEAKLQDEKALSFWDWLSGARKQHKHSIKNSAEGNLSAAAPAPPKGFFEWLISGPAEPGPANSGTDAEKLKAKAKKVREKREASEPLKARRKSMAALPKTPSEAGQQGSRGRAASHVAGDRRPSLYWPAAEDILDDKLGKIVVPPKDPLLGDRRDALASYTSPETETVEIIVNELFDGRLGVRLKMEGLVVSNFDVDQAKDLGWRVGDEIVAVNGQPVHTRELFRNVLADARKALPIAFTVVRSSAGPRPSVSMGMSSTRGSIAEGPLGPLSPSTAEGGSPLSDQPKEAARPQGTASLRKASRAGQRPSKVIDTE
eukprot:TRINITY_DN75318_c0_g1_i1.p1 TRINITY_DN75318_c0_g1~~TRINITY_DN75318_c0_g1_i1.p1  ORF type:complete len:1379 (-),score=339.43 TRINITY_DN75318_c0_g1_i1:282-4418(-)